MSNRYFFSKFLFFILFFLPAFVIAARCPVCGMDVKAESKTKLQFTAKESKTEVCSFVCASRFSKKHADQELLAPDFKKGEWVAAKTAFFLVKSKNLLKQTDVPMLPGVVAFKNEPDALEMKKSLGDGEVVQGFDAAVRVYE